MPESAPSPEEIVEILEEALTEWEWSHERLARQLGCSKESVENWLKRRTRPRPKALRAILLIREHLQSGERLPPKLEAIRRASPSGGTGPHEPSPLDEPTGAIATEAANVVRRFFEAIGSRNIEQAWQCLTRAFQERRWPGGYEMFRVGYDCFRGMDNLIVVPLRPVVPPVCRVFVYYEDTTDLIELPGFGKWSTAQLGHLDECSRLLAALKDRVLSAGAHRTAVEQILLSSLFTEQAGNVVHTASRMRRDDFFNAIGLDTTYQGLLAMPMIARVFRQGQGRFLIDQLLPVHWARRAPGRA